MNSSQSRSRRYICAPHNFDRSRIRRCPICQWAVDQDHLDALAMNAALAQTKSLPQAAAPSDASDDDKLIEAGFALL